MIDVIVTIELFGDDSCFYEWLGKISIILRKGCGARGGKIEMKIR